MRMHFLLHRRQTRCGCWGHRGSSYSGVDVAHIAVHRELFTYFRFFLCRQLLFSNYHSVDFQFLPDLIGCHSMVKFKLIIFIFRCTSSNMVAEGIREQASGRGDRSRSHAFKNGQRGCSLLCIFPILAKSRYIARNTLHCLFLCF